MKRHLSVGVPVMEFSALDAEHRQLPTDSQVRDAIARARAELEKLAQKRAASESGGWREVESEQGYRMVDSGTHLVLRAWTVIERAE